MAKKPKHQDDQNDVEAIPTSTLSKTELANEDLEEIEEEKVESPAVLGEQNPFSGDATSSESPDIDEEMEKVGKHGDEEGVKPLGED